MVNPRIPHIHVVNVIPFSHGNTVFIRNKFYIFENVPELNMWSPEGDPVPLDTDILVNRFNPVSNIRQVREMYKKTKWCTMCKEDPEQLEKFLIDKFLDVYMCSFKKLAYGIGLPEARKVFLSHLSL